MNNKTLSLSNFIKTGFNAYFINPLLLIAVSAIQFIVSRGLMLPMTLLSQPNPGIISLVSMFAIIFFASFVGMFLYAGYIRVGLDLYDRRQSNLTRLLSGLYVLPKLIGGLLVFTLPIVFGAVFFILGFASIALHILTRISPTALASLGKALNPGTLEAFARMPLMVMVPLFVASMPLLWISLRWLFTFHVLVDKNCSIVSAFKTSFAITPGYLLHILAPYLLTLPLYLPLMRYLGKDVGGFVYALTAAPVLCMIFLATYRMLLAAHEERAERA